MFCTFCKSCTCFETPLEHGPSQMLSYRAVHCPLQCQPAHASLALSLAPKLDWIMLFHHENGSLATFLVHSSQLPHLVFDVF